MKHEKATAAAEKKKSTARVGRAPRRVHPRVAPFAKDVGAAPADMRFFGVTKQDPDSGAWEPCQASEGGVMSDRWSLELFSMDYIRERWVEDDGGEQVFKCVWYGDAGQKPIQGRVFRLLGSEDEEEEAEEEDGEFVPRSVLEALAAEVKRAGKAAPAARQESAYDLLRMIREERNDATKSMVEVFRLALDARNGAPAPAALPADVQAIVAEHGQNKLADQVVAKLGGMLGKKKADDDDDDDDPQFAEWADLWEFLEDDAKQDVAELIIEHKPRLKHMIPELLKELKNLAKAATANGAAAKEA